MLKLKDRTESFREFDPLALEILRYQPKTQPPGQLTKIKIKKNKKKKKKKKKKTKKRHFLNFVYLF